MRSPGDILLLSCYELGHQPFQLASLLTLLRQAGYAPVAVDTAVETLTDETISRACFVGISVPMHTALRLGEQIAQRVRSLNPAAHLCLYGLYASLNADYLLQGTVDSAIGGEYEEPLLKLLAALENREPISIPGVSTRQQNSKPWIQRAPFVVPERASLPPLERYARLELNGEMRLAGYTETTRGCKHTCQHCPITPIYSGRFFAVPAEIVLADMRALVKRGAQHITFGDPDFFNGPTHALALVTALAREFPGVSYDVTIKVEHLRRHADALTTLRDTGCAFVTTAVESFDDEVLRRLAKGHTAADIARAFELLRHHGLAVNPTFIPFHPWMTFRNYQTFLREILNHGLVENVAPIQLALRLLVPAGFEPGALVKLLVVLEAQT